MDVGISILVDKMVRECEYEYSLDLSNSLDKHAVIRFVYGKIIDIMPLHNRTVNSLVLEAVQNHFKLKQRQMYYIIKDETSRSRKILGIIRRWESHIFDVGTRHIIRNKDWYATHGWILKEQGLLNKKGEWVRDRYSEKLNYCDKPATIISNVNNKVHIAQDCGIFEWSLIELMGGNYERLGTQTTSELR